MDQFDHKGMQARWAGKWEQDNVCGAEDFSEKPKKYILVEFPYPSGTGLHMGHFIRFTLPDVYARLLRMSGHNVLFPIGWDAFGLPAENYAVETGVHPKVTTEKAISNFKHSLRHAGFGVDWNRIVNTTDPEYYKWTQWIFLRLWEAGLAFLSEEPVWWCEKLRTVLANEEVLEDEKGNKISERGGHPVEKRKLKQWVLKITAYADKLLAGLDKVDYPDSVKLAQKNWIGRSEGARIVFSLASETGAQSSKIEVFTTRPDTIFGATFVVLAPEHPAVDALKDQIKNFSAIQKYRQTVANFSDIDREKIAGKEKTGQKLEGVFAEHPLVSGWKLPVYIADYVLMAYGTGAIMAVPAHDERDFEFAKKYNLEIRPTVFQEKSEKSDAPPDKFDPSFTEPGVVRVTPEIKAALGKALKQESAIDSEKMKSLVIAELTNRKLGQSEVTYRMRDWVFSRQRYWGEPIPMLHQADGKVEALVNTNDAAGVAKLLPLKLPEVPDYTPSSDGTSPLARNKDWVTSTDLNGKPVMRETNTMPNWAGSCWYYLRYLDPKNDQAFAAPEKLKYWLPVDKYFGGGEHTTLHLLYSRFWHQFLFDQGLVPTPEPYNTRITGGILLGEDGFKQSKSRGNGIDLNEMLEQYGADALRMYICFLGPYEATIPWNTGGLKACRRLVESIYDLKNKLKPGSQDDPKVTRLYHKTLKNVAEMLKDLKGNTAVSAIMILVNELKTAQTLSPELWSGFVRLISPFAVFLAEELWQESRGGAAWQRAQSVHLQPWPKYDPALAKDETIEVAVQVNGKVRGQLSVAENEAEDAVKTRVMEIENVQKWLAGKEVKKFLYVPGKIVSIVTN